MNFTLTEEQRHFIESVKKFAERHLSEDSLSRAHTTEYPRDVAKILADQGLMGITLTETSGGQGGNLMDAVLAIEQIANICPRSADVIQAGNFGAIRTLAEFGSEFLKEKYLSSLLKGDTLIAIGMTEPEAGSAVTDLKTSAVAKEDGYVVNGTKVFATNSLQADVILAYVRFNPGINGIGSVLIDKDADGVSFGNPVKYLGGDEWAQIYFENVNVPKKNVLLKEGGFKKQISGFNVERIGNAARSLGLGQLAFSVGKSHAVSRRQFDRNLCEFQGLQWKFADVKLELDSAQLLLYRAAVNADKGLPSAEETAMAKLACNRAGFNASNLALQVLGGTGFSQDGIVEYCFRRTRGWMIAGGSLEMMQNKIAECIFERRFSQRM